jgi:hypothetical protein
MSDAQNSGSEVARLLAQICEEYEAAERGLSGLALGTSKHEFVTKKMENMGKLQLQLGELVGDMPSIALIAEHLGALPDRTVGVVPPNPVAQDT